MRQLCEWDPPLTRPKIHFVPIHFSAQHRKCKYSVGGVVHCHKCRTGLNSMCHWLATEKSCPGKIHSTTKISNESYVSMVASLWKTVKFILTPLFCTMISYTDLPMRRFPNCCHVLIVSRGCAKMVPHAPINFEITQSHNNYKSLPSLRRQLNNFQNDMIYTTNAARNEITVNYHHF